MKATLIKTLLALFVLVFLTQCNKGNNIPLVSQHQTLTQAINVTMPKPDHIVIVIEENRSYSQIMGSDSAPYINSLTNNGYSVIFTNSYGVTHPSQPNYLDLYSGSNQGIATDKVPSQPFISSNLGRELLDAGKSFKTFSQSLPQVGYTGDSTGTYVKRHNPAANWMGTGTNQIPDSTNQPLTAFPIDYSLLPTVSFVIPNLNYDMHDGSIRQGDAWLKIRLDPYIQWASTHNSLFIITFDEDDRKDSNHIFTMFCGPMIRSGKDDFILSHYRVLRTIEDMYGIPYTGLAANGKTITNCWK